LEEGFRDESDDEGDERMRSGGQDGRMRNA
jgi:hypothetical protein